MSGERQHVVVIGGGISGLAAAYHLRDHADVTLIEASDRLGGAIHTLELGGVRIEAGADAFVAARPEINELCAALGLPCIDSHDGDGRASILHDGRLHPLPAGFRGITGADPTGLRRTPLLSPVGRLRAAWGARRSAPRLSDDVSVAMLVRRHLGREAYQAIVEPLVTGVMAGDPSRMSSAALLRPRTTPTSASGQLPAFRRPVGGMGRLVDALVAAIGDVRTGTPAVDVARTDAGYVVDLASGERLYVRAAVLAVPTSVASGLLDLVAPDAAEELGSIRTVSTAVVTLIYEGSTLPPGIGHGYVIPRATGRPAVAVTIASNKFREPGSDRVVLRVFLGREGQPNPLDLDDNGLTALASGEVTTTLGITRSPRVVHVGRWPNALPQYDLGHLARVGRIRAALDSHPCLALAGASYDGIGVPDCIRSGREAAERIVAATPRQ